jgi:hypothetical protein
VTAQNAPAPTPGRFLRYHLPDGTTRPAICIDARDDGGKVSLHVLTLGLKDSGHFGSSNALPVAVKHGVAPIGPAFEHAVELLAEPEAEPDTHAAAVEVAALGAWSWPASSAPEGLPPGVAWERLEQVIDRVVALGAQLEAQVGELEGRVSVMERSLELAAMTEQHPAPHKGKK